MDITPFRSLTLKKGFTLIEIMTVIAITVLITGTSIRTLSRTRVALDRTASELRALFREAQTSALSGVLFSGVTRCGYGVHIEPVSGGVQTYMLYAGPNATSVTCSTQNRNYAAGSDVIVRSIQVQSSIEIVTPVSDVFFEPPNPTTFINNSNSQVGTVTLTIRKVGSQCPSTDCRTVTVKAAGTIQSP